MVVKTKKDKLAQDSLRASRIEQVLSMPGWNDIKDIIQNKYNDAMNDLLKGENPEARGTINALTEIMDGISLELKFGEKAKKEYTKQNFAKEIDGDRL